MAEEEVLGIVGLLSDVRQGFNIEVVLIATVSDQMGVAVQGHCVRQIAQQNALLAERQRLARDLRDSVRRLCMAS